MIGQPLDLGHQRAQMASARRHVHLPCRFERVSKSERIGDGAVARCAAREPCRPLEGGPRHERLNSLVHVTEALFQPYHRLAIRGKAKMSGLDNSRMHRSHWNLMQALAFDRQEVVRGRAPPPYASPACSGG